MVAYKASQMVLEGGTVAAVFFVLHVGSSRTQASTNNSEQGLADDIWQIVIGDLDD
jgi:hypothetical protein